jgi:hypothetical protein
MPNEPENLVFDPNVVQKLESNEAIRNYVDQRIETVRQMMESQPPPPTNELTSLAYLKWERRFLMTHGRAVEAICAAQAFGHITVEEFQTFKQKLIATTLLKTSAVQLGTA